MTETELPAAPEVRPAVLEVRGASALFSFEGRVSRGTFWKITILNTVFGTIATFIGKGGLANEAFNATWVSLSLGALLGAVTTWQWLATQVKRWHDQGESGWMAILGCIPLVNLYAFYRLGFIKGTVGENKYGEGPHDISLL